MEAKTEKPASIETIRADVVAASEFCADEMRALINRMEAK